MSLVPNRLRRRSLYKGILPTNLAIEYYRCPRCGLVGIIVTHKSWFNCGRFRCEAYLHLGEVGVTKEEYDRVWGLST